MTWNLIWAAVRLAALYYVAQGACHFTVLQSVFLTGLAALSVEAAYLRHSAARRFRPFQLWIRPNYPEILMDAGVLTTLEEYRELLNANHLSGDDLFKGATCWVLAYNSDTDRHTVAWPEWNRYTSQIELSLAHFELESLSTAAALPAACRAGNGKLAAAFGLKPGSTGIKVFMRIDQEWWNARWADASGKPKFAEDPDLLSAAINLTFAEIPYDELQGFYCWKPGWSISVRRRRRTLSNYGWLNKTTPETYVIDKAVDLEHRYVEILHQPA